MNSFCFLQIKVQVTRPAEDGTDNKVVKETSFRRELLTKCQKEFEKDKKDDVTREIRTKAIQEATTVSIHVLSITIKHDGVWSIFLFQRKKRNN